MAVVVESRGALGQAIEIYNDAVVNITSVDVAAQDEIIASQKIGTRDKGKCTIQVVESNGKEAKIQPWISLDGTNWDEIDYSDAQKHFELDANGVATVFVDDALSFKFLKLTGYLPSAGTAKVIARVLIE